MLFGQTFLIWSSVINQNVPLVIGVPNIHDRVQRGTTKGSLNSGPHNWTCATCASTLENKSPRHNPNWHIHE